MSQADLTENLEEFELLKAKAEAYDVIAQSIELRRSAEFQRGIKSLRMENIPQKNSEPYVFSAWVVDLLDEVCSNNISHNNDSHDKYKSKSEKIAKQNIRSTNSVKNKKKMRRSEYEKKKIYLENMKLKTQNQINNLMSSNNENNRQMILLGESLKIIEEGLKELENISIIEDPEEKPDQNNDQNQNSENSNDNTHGSNSENTDSTNQKDDIEEGQEENGFQKFSKDLFASLSEVLRKIFENKKKAKEESKKKKKEEKEKGARNTHRNIRDFKKPIVKPKDTGKITDPKTLEEKRVYNINNMKNNVNKLTTSNESAINVVNQYLDLVDQEGEHFTKDPATCTDLELKYGDDNNQSVIQLDDDLILNPEDQNIQNEKEKLNILHYSKNLMAILTLVNGKLVFSPTEFLGIPSIIYGNRGCFVRCILTDNAVVSYVTDFVLYNTSKRRIKDVINMKHGDTIISHQYLIEIMIGFVRCLKFLAIEHKRILLSCNKIIHADETPFKCLSLLKNENGEKIRSKNYVWVFVSGKHSDTKGVFYHVSPTRNYKNVIDVFTDDMGEAIPAVEIMITDGFKSYDIAINELETTLKRKIERQNCIVHLRRYFLKALNNMGLLELFNRISHCDCHTYNETVENEIKENNIKINYNGRDILFATFLLEQILLLDSDFAIADRKSLEQRRNEYSKYLLDLFYKKINRLKETIPDLKTHKTKLGGIAYSGTKTVSWASGVIYALNNKKYVYTFINNGDVETQNNISELSARSIVTQRKNVLFSVSKDGFKSFADIKSIIDTCKINDVNPYHYILWAWTNAKMRLEEERFKICQEKNTNKQICWLPKPKKGEDGKIIKLYDDDYTCPFDSISWNGLDIWTYKKLMNAETKRIKKSDSS